MARIMKDYRRLFFLFALITLSFFSDIYAQEDYLLVFRNVDKATFQLPVKTPRRSENSDELRTRIMDEMDSCIIQKDTLTIYFSFNGLTVYLDTITSNFDLDYIKKHQFKVEYITIRS